VSAKPGPAKFVAYFSNSDGGNYAFWTWGYRIDFPNRSGDPGQDRARTGRSMPSQSIASPIRC